MRLEIEDCYACEYGHTVDQPMDEAVPVKGESDGYLGCPACEKGFAFVECSFRFRVIGE